MFLNIFTIVIQLSFSILCFYGAVHLVRKESLFTRPIIVKNLEAFLLVVVVGSLFGLMSFVTAHNDLYKPWAIKKTISKAISERNISF